MMVANPIFIHSFAVFLRLHWFEKKIDNVNAKSKLQSHMRRTATFNTQNGDTELGVKKSHEPHKLSLDLSSSRKVFKSIALPQLFSPSSQSGSSTKNGLSLVEPEIKAPQETTVEKSETNVEVSKPTALVDRDIKFVDSVAPTATKEGNLSNKASDLADLTGKAHAESSSASVTSSTELSTGLQKPQFDDVTSSPPLKRSKTIHQYSQIDGTLQRTASFDQYLSSVRHEKSLTRVLSANYVSWQPTIEGNSVFVGLTPEQREELGGVEYRALKLLSRILITYYVGFHLMGALMLMAYGMIKQSSYQDTVYTPAGIHPVWWAIFTSSSAFTNCGLTLTANSMLPFQQSVFPILVSGFLIIAGNTGFPILLRFFIWVMFKCVRKNGRTHESLGFLLDHPRRCFTLLFPSYTTWWLLIVLLAFNAVDLIIFCALDINSPVVNFMPVGHRILDGLFQSVSSRTCGLAVFDLSQTHVAVQVTYMVMMYVSVLPLAMSIRSTNVYEEQSLGVYVDHENTDSKSPSLIATHLRKQLSFDLWFVFLALFIITIAEGDKLSPTGNPYFSTFSVMFEIVSAYGTVGLSLGFPNTNTSFTAQFSVVSKLVIIAVMFRGRHRGLPYALDRAIILPSDKLDKEDNAQERLMRRATEVLPLHEGNPVMVYGRAPGSQEGAIDSLKKD